MRHAALSLLALLTVLALAPGCRDQQREDFVLPADLAALLPATPHVLVAARGLAAVEAALADLDARTGDEPALPPGLRSRLDLAALLEEAVPGLAAAVDPQRPLALAVVGPPPMVQQELLITLVVPLRDPGAPPPAPRDAAVRSPVVHGGYAAYSTDPALAARDSVPALALGLRPGLVTAAVDLRALIGQYRGMVELGLGMLAMAPAQGAGDGEPAMSPQEAQALAAMLRGLMDSADRLDLACGLEQGELSVAGGLGITAVGPLRPAADQPDFARAAALTGLLPGADLLEAWAMDQTRELEFMRAYYLAGIRREMAALPPEQAAAYETWFTAYLDLVPQLACPGAAAVDFGEDGIGLLAVLEPADPAALAAALTAQMELLSAAGVGLAFVPDEAATTGGVTVNRWRVEFDDDALRAGLARGGAGSSGSGQAAQTLLVLGDLLPQVSLAAAGPRVLLGATTGGGAFAELVARADARGKADPRVAQAAAAAGPDCRQVAVGDLMPLFNWMTGLVGELAGETDLPRLETPVPFRSVATTGAAGYGFALTTDVPAVRAAVDAVRAMAAGRKGR